LEAIMSVYTFVPARRRLATAAVLFLAALLGACDNYHDHGYNNCLDYMSCVPVGTGLVYTAGIAAGDLNGDGKADIATTRTQSFADPGQVLVYLQSSAMTGGLLSPAQYPNGAGFGWVGIADLNHDGLPDLLTANDQSGVIALYFNDAAQKGTFSLPQYLISPGVSQVAVLDMTGDGYADLVAADYQVSLFVQNGSQPGTFLSAVPLYPGGANWVALGDLNHDGMPDIALVDAVGVKVLFHQGAASATTYSAPVPVYTQTVVPGLYGANMVAIASLKADGYMDLVITDPSAPGVNPTVNVLLQDRMNPGNFLAPLVYTIQGGDPGAYVLVQDIDHDGCPDIVVGGNFAISVLLNEPGCTGSFQAAMNYPVPEPAPYIALADVNGDTFLDIVTTTSASGLQSGLTSTPLGVLYQDAMHPGTFMALADL
jgi:hypothetical protein